MLARVFDHGGLFLFHLREDEVDVPEIEQNRCPDIAMSRFGIYKDFGMDVPDFASAPEPAI